MIEDFWTHEKSTNLLHIPGLSLHTVVLSQFLSFNFWFDVTHTHMQRANILYFFNLFLIPLFIEILTDGGMCEPQQGRTNHELECKWDKNMWMLVFASDTSLILVKVTLLTVRMITISVKQV